MFAGHPPFSGDTTADIIAAIIQKEPANASVHNPAVTEKLDRIINKCLAKDRNKRYATASELLVELKESARPVVAKDEEPDVRQESENRFREVPVTASASAYDRSVQPSAKKSLVGAVLFVLALSLGVAAIYWYLAELR